MTEKEVCPMTGKSHIWVDGNFGEYCQDCGRLKHDAIEPILKAPPGLKQRIEKLKTIMGKRAAELKHCPASTFIRGQVQGYENVLTELDKTIGEMKTPEFAERVFKIVAKKCNWVNDDEERSIIMPLLLAYMSEVLKALDSGTIKTIKENSLSEEGKE